MRFHIYKDAAGEWRWRLIAANGRIIADSAEGYASTQDCRTGIDLVKSTTLGTPVTLDEPGTSSGGPRGKEPLKA